ncbi:response regulator [Paenibacillus daejeonensis]|uniref:response regulator n=1 Tax=Paenibacillus daejeonensis TaxID=135193 RepID=UPI00035E404D|nr:response regulator [Paenibacillus daejeonensis]
MKLMIVEDEPRLRHALVHDMPWEEHEIEVIGVARNGVEALALIATKAPDLMIIDVQMPQMDGLTLVRKLHEQKGRSLLKMIILSGHDNFAYAQDAMEHGVTRYLLKPAGEEVILQAVLDAASELREELDQWQSKAMLEQKWEAHLPGLHTHFFQRWAAGELTGWEVLKQSKELLIELQEKDRIAVAVAGVDPIPEGNTRFFSHDLPLLQFTLLCMAKELLDHPSCWISSDADYRVLLVFVLPPEQPPEEAMLYIQAALDKLLSQMREVLKLTASAGICEAPGDLEQMSQLYTQACRALQERLVYGPDIVIPYREAPRQEQPPALSQEPLEKALEIALETADEAKALEALTALWESGQDTAASSEDVQEFVLYLSSLFIRLIHKQGWTVRQVMGEDMMYLHNLSLLGTREQTRSWLNRTARSITAFMQEQRRTTSNQVVQDILAIVEREIDQDLTLHTVADRLYISPSYLSRLFKQSMGVAFSAYVLEHKMERAKAILQEGLKVYDAARQTGYRDVSYFTKVFRKYWGVNPGEYKP